MMNALKDHRRARVRHPSGAVREEIKTGLPTKGHWHAEKAANECRHLYREIQVGKFSGKDLALAKALVIDLSNALMGK